MPNLIENDPPPPPVRSMWGCEVEDLYRYFYNNTFFILFKPFLQKTLNVVPSTRTFMCFTLLLLSSNVLLTFNTGNNLLSFISHPRWMNHAESLRVNFNI